MTDATEMPRRRPGKPAQSVYARKWPHRPISLEGPPTPEEVASSPHKGEAADRFSLYTPDQLEIETRTVRFDITFKEVVRFRDQAAMVVACMEEIIRISKQHDLGSDRQRINARREADSLRRALARFNGKKPRTNTYQDR